MNLDDSRYARPAEVERLARVVVGDVLNDEWLCAVLETCDAAWEDGARFGAADLLMRVGGWRLDLGRTGVRTGLTTSIVAGALVQQGVTQMVIGVVAAVIPSVLDIERVALSPGDRMLLLELRTLPQVRDRALTEDELYARLPDGIRAVVNRFDFADFVKRVREAWYATPGESTVLRDPEGPPVRFNWR